MGERNRKIMFLLTIVVSLTVLAAPARGADWFTVSAGTNGFGLYFGSSNWAVYGSTWHDPYWAVSYDVALAGYGEWVWVGGLGRCWRPYVAVDWRPFTHGRWVWTSYGWTWVAYEPWGYFPHHFGHWAYSQHGWVWAPGYSYQSANVVWVHSGSWVGWYACPPRGWSHTHRGYNRGYRHGYDDGYWDGWDDARYATYTEWRHIGSDNISRHAVSIDTVRRSSSPATTRTTASPPSRAETRHRGGYDVPEAQMDHRVVTAGDRTIAVARPRGMGQNIEQNARATANSALAPHARRQLLEPGTSQTARNKPSRNTATPDRQAIGVSTARPSRTTRGDAVIEGRVRDSETVNRPTSNSSSPRLARTVQEHKSERRSVRTADSTREIHRKESAQAKSARSQTAQRTDATDRRRPVAREKTKESRSKDESSRRQKPSARRR